MTTVNASLYRLLGKLILIRGYHLLAAALILAGMIIALPLSFLSNANVWLGLLLLPYALILESKRRFNYWYCALTIAFGVLSVCYGVRMFYFFTIAFCLLTLIEFFSGRTNTLVLLLVIAMSPFFNQVLGLLGFPIRLILSSSVGSILNLGGWDVYADGNVIVMDDASFSVDQACMGLNMLAISMLMAVFMIAFHTRKQNRKLQLPGLVAVFISTFALNIVANFIRMLMLVIFKVLPAHPMHELIGLVSLGLYILVPLYFVCRWMVTRWGKPFDSPSPRMPMNAREQRIVVATMLALLIIGVIVNYKRSNMVHMNTQVVIQNEKIGHDLQDFSNLKVQLINDNVTKISNDQILLYIKPIPEFFTGEHSPLFCWQGGGYEFKKIKATTIFENQIYIGQIVNGNEKLHTAWWYSNGSVRTIDQFDWRLRMMKGEPSFNLINITCPSEKQLIDALKAIFETRIITVNNNSI